MSCFPQRTQAEEETLRDENSQIFHRLQSLLIRVNIAGISLLGLTSSVDFSPLHWVLICETHILPRLSQFCTQLRGKLAYKGPYQVILRGLRLQLPEPQVEDSHAKKVRAGSSEEGLKNSWEENADRVLCYQSLLYIPEIMMTELVSRHHDDPLVGHFGIDKTWELIA